MAGLWGHGSRAGGRRSRAQPGAGRHQPRRDELLRRVRPKRGRASRTSMYAQYARARRINGNDGQALPYFNDPKIDVFLFVNQLVYDLPGEALRRQRPPGHQLPSCRSSRSIRALLRRPPLPGVQAEGQRRRPRRPDVRPAAAVPADHRRRSTRVLDARRVRRDRADRLVRPRQGHQPGLQLHSRSTPTGP